MKKYIGTKEIMAEQMTVAEFNEKVRPLIYTGSCQEGYHVFYEDGYESWSPKDVFEHEFRSVEGMTFGRAIEAIKKGYRVAREEWICKGMFIYHVAGRMVDKEFTRNEASIQPIFDNTGVAKFNSHIDKKLADGSVCVGWTASQEDICAEDWLLID